MKPKDLPLFRDPEARKVLAAACRKHGVTVELLRRLLDVQRSYAGMQRQQGITVDFEACLAEFLEDHDEKVA